MVSIEALHVLNQMKQIQNVRTYDNKKLEAKDEKMLYEAFLAGPSSISNQARELIVIGDSILRNKLANDLLSPYMVKESIPQKWIEDVPFLSVIVIEKRRAMSRIGSKGILIAQKEAESAIQNMRLLATCLQINSAIIREFEPETIRETLSLSWYVEPVAMLACGYALGESPMQLKSLSMENMIHKDRWS